VDTKNQPFLTEVFVTSVSVDDVVLVTGSMTVSEHDEGGKWAGASEFVSRHAAHGKDMHTAYSIALGRVLTDLSNQVVAAVNDHVLQEEKDKARAEAILAKQRESAARARAARAKKLAEQKEVTPPKAHTLKPEVTHVVREHSLEENSSFRAFSGPEPVIRTKDFQLTQVESVPKKSNSNPQSNG